MPFKARIAELAMKIEVTSGTFNAPATDGTESKLLLIDPVLELPFEVHERDIMHSGFSKFASIIGKTPARLTFGIEMRRTATGVSEDQWNNLFRIAGMVGTNPASNVVFKPSSLEAVDHKTASFYAYIGSSGSTSVRVALKGGAAKIRGVHENSKTSMLLVEVDAVYNGISTGGAVNSVSHEATVPSKFAGVSFTYAGVAAKIARFAWDLGNDVQARESVNASEGIDYFHVVDRKPTFEFDPEWELTGTIDWMSHFLNATESAVAFNIQSTNLTFAAPKAQITGIRPGVRNGLRIAECTGQLNRSSGDDEIVITKA